MSISSPARDLGLPTTANSELARNRSEEVADTRPRRVPQRVRAANSRPEPALDRYEGRSLGSPPPEVLPSAMQYRLALSAIPQALKPNQMIVQEGRVLDDQQVLLAIASILNEIR